MKNTAFLAIFLACLSLSLASPVRVIHAIADAPAVDVYIDGDLVFAGAEYKDITEYAELTQATHDFTITLANSIEDVVASGSFDVDSSPLTVGAVGTVSGNDFQVITWPDDNAVPEEGKTRVKFVHLAYGAPNVDIFSGDTKVFSDIGYQYYSTYQEIDGGEYDLAVHPAGSNTVVLNVDNVEFEEDKVYTVYAVGIVATKKDTALTAIISQDADYSDNAASGLALSMFLIAMCLMSLF